ncbi:class I SAM-dependent methyltransferase [Halobacterium wangiae]|uniref:class I SAM-dependent methyltransferase n=1 Tax=Halobacterium wangiae TaxID=2902623 RepID=UPI001E50F5FE|nr:class I SAM-dependent methyltransferase [Halobacterium wangiae]
MDESLQTAATYEDHADAYCEKYRTASVAERHGDPFFDALAGDRVLDAGCGPGSDAAVFAARGLDVVGVDITHSFVAAAREDVDGAFVRGDLRSLPVPDGAFDGVWACAVLHHLPKPAAVDALAEFERVLADDGVLFCSVKRGESAGFEPDDDHGGGDDRFFAYYGGDEFRELLADAGLEGEARAEGRWVNTLATPR